MNIVLKEERDLWCQIASSMVISRVAESVRERRSSRNQRLLNFLNHLVTQNVACARHFPRSVFCTHAPLNASGEAEVFLKTLLDSNFGDARLSLYLLKGDELRSKPG